jgi:hypothetical protein
MTKKSFQDDAEELEVRVKGRIGLGKELKLESSNPFAADRRANALPGVNRRVPFHEQMRPVAPHKDVERRMVEHRLDPLERKVPMSDQGLVLQYGILGAPGSGKTNLLMHLLRQVVAHEGHDPALKFGGLILDPKAALIKDVDRIFRRLGRRDDLVVINERELVKKEPWGVNIIDCTLSSTDLGRPWSSRRGARASGRASPSGSSEWPRCSAQYTC